MNPLNSLKISKFIFVQSGIYISSPSNAIMNMNQAKCKHKNIIKLLALQ